jgi:S-adenosyl methyltransferase
VTQDQPGQAPRFDTSVASIARIYDYWLGGKDNYAVDREAGDAMVRQYPDIVAGVRMNRAFLGRAVHYLAAEAGIGQFLDIGTGLPSSNNTHEVAQRAAPESRIVYVDNDPIVLSHARALLTSTAEGACAYIDADIRDAGKILQDAASTLDFSRPVAVCLIMILQFVPDEDDPWQIVRTLMDAVPSGSYLAIAHPANDVDQYVGPALRQLSTRMGGTRAAPRSHQEVARFFEGLEMIEPGLVQLHRWRPGTGVRDNGRELAAYGGVGRKT